MASSLEFNKIAAAVLTAGIVASLSGFIARELVHPEPLAKTAYNVPATEEKATAGGEEKGGEGPGDIQPLMASANVDAGKAATKVCAACHTFDQGGANKVGPNLFGIVNEPIGQGKGYQFSDALKSKGGTWTPQALNEWLYKPQAFAKGTKMTFAGISKAQERANIIAYLESLK
jgi:cytochrome c